MEKVLCRGKCLKCLSNDGEGSFWCIVSPVDVIQLRKKQRVLASKQAIANSTAFWIASFLLSKSNL